MSAHDIHDHVFDGPHGPLRVRVYSPESPSGHGLVWAHGGGFAGGDIDMPEADAVARAFADRGIAVMSVDYALAPMTAEWSARLGAEKRGGVHYPVPHDEMVSAFRWAATSDVASRGWAIGGASAGGNLATGAALRLAHEGGAVPALAVLAYPTLQAVQAAPDPELRALLDGDPSADVFTPDFVRGMYENYLGSDPDTADVYAVPGTAEPAALSSFPPTIMVNDETDELRVSGEAFARSLAAAGVEVEVVVEPGTTHGHLNRPEESAFAATIDRFAARILQLP
ncbi:alpha/beta hydrolase fold domain-containing protein [Microbacterium sp. KSW4-4]|uniref:alpha/beta hydrolase fold domain-containing protein n=1 Tax=Microbacterium sp. KSW4-4 TaxID=2851651 RepID=UPI001FFC5A00|nr:alpha/beta hydrolase fold domain-containing protein [Microbacterium sp. KSW4-4]MCK2033781.1 alpha/beta hydrolase [Microbacterium sp. KSW4-4]